MIGRLMKTEEMSTNPFQEGVISSSPVFYIFTFAADKLQS